VVDPPESFSPQDLVTYDEAHKSLVPAAYVTFQFSGNDFDVYQEFSVGNEAQSNSRTRSKRSCDDYKQYYNKPLQPNTNYRVFLRAFVTEVLYISSNFVEIKIKEKPAVKKLPEKSIFSVGELVLLTCEVTGDPEPSVTWTKNGNSSIPRAQFKNDGRILIIKDVLPGDRGVYECKASNKFGESRTSTTLIVAVPPRITKEVSPSSVICERQTLCTFSCHATSGSPFNYTWTKNGQILVSDDIKIMNNIIVLTPRDTEDYGVYVCHATNRFGSTSYKITVSEGHKSSTSPGGNSVFRATTITFSFIVFVLLVVILVLIWRLRRAVPNNRTTTASIVDRVDQSDPPRDQYVSEPDSYMELRSRPPEGKLCAPLEYTGLQCIDSNAEYYNAGIDENDKRDRQEDIYYEIRNA